MPRKENGVTIYGPMDISAMMGLPRKTVKLNDESLSQEDWLRDWERNLRWRQVVYLNTGDGERYLRGIVMPENWDHVGDMPDRVTIRHYEWWGGFIGEWVEDTRKATYFYDVRHMLALLERANVRGAYSRF